MWSRIQQALYQLGGRFRRFMMGRNGSDQFNLALLVVYLLLSVLSAFFRWFPVVYAVLYLLSLAVLGVFFWRFFSRKVANRQLENERFLNWWYPKRHAFTQWRARQKDKDHVYVKCKQCGQRLRLPKHRGVLAVTCPKCGRHFQKKT